MEPLERLERQGLKSPGDATADIAQATELQEVLMSTRVSVEEAGKDELHAILFELGRKSEEDKFPYLLTVLPRLEEHLEDERPFNARQTNREFAIRLLVELSESTDSSHKKAALEVFARHLDTFFEMIKSKRLSEVKYEDLKTAVDFTSQSDASNRFLENLMEGFLENTDNPVCLRLLCEIVCDYATVPVYSELIKGKIVDYLKLKLRLSEKEVRSLMNVWRLNITDKEKNGRGIAMNLQKIMELEKEKEGLCAQLLHSSGIQFFARYTNELLLEQGLNQEEAKPYGICIYPHADYNGAFYQNKGELQRLSEQLKGMGFCLRIAECGNFVGLGRRLLSYEQKYGTSHKISFMLLAGHGTKDTISLGHSGLRTGVLNKADISNETARKLKACFVEKASIILVSCSTGAEGGIADKLSEFASTVFAPTADTHLKSIDISELSGSLDFIVEYYAPSRRIEAK